MSEEINVTQSEEKKNTFNLKKEVFEWFYTIVIAVAIAFLIKGFLFDLVVVDGPSMHPTLVHGDRLVVTKLGYEPEIQDIIVLDSTYADRQAYYNNLGNLNFIQKAFEYFKLPEGLKTKYYVKRVIGLPGDTVDLVENKVYVNGAELDEYYYDGETFAYDAAVSFPFTVSDGHVFVLGDNRPQSKDSRSSSLGEVPIDAISGKCSLRFWPFGEAGTLGDK